MDTKAIIEAVGYLGSLLVLISFLMTSVMKLRIVNTVGSVIFTIYALIIRSYPTAIMNVFIILINIRFLLKMKDHDKEYELTRVNADDEYLRHLLGHYKDDIDKCFPGISYDLNACNACYIVSHDGKPTGITLTQSSGGEVEFLLDYTIPEYRDFSIGSFLFDKLKEEGLNRIIYRGPAENHLVYLDRFGFVREDDHFIKNL